MLRTPKNLVGFAFQAADEALSSAFETCVLSYSAGAPCSWEVGENKIWIFMIKLSGFRKHAPDQVCNDQDATGLRWQMECTWDGYVDLKHRKLVNEEIKPLKFEQSPDSSRSEHRYWVIQNDFTTDIIFHPDEVVATLRRFEKSCIRAYRLLGYHPA